jgi:hypothetical protein
MLVVAVTPKYLCIVYVLCLGNCSYSCDIKASRLDSFGKDYQQWRSDLGEGCLPR